MHGVDDERTFSPRRLLREGAVDRWKSAVSGRGGAIYGELFMEEEAPFIDQVVR